MEKDGQTIFIPSVLADRIKARLSHSKFETIDDYVSFAMDQLLSDLEGKNNIPLEEQGASQKTIVYSQTEQQDIERRLRDLGYI
jgi:hypothetical protein